VGKLIESGKQTSVGHVIDEDQCRQEKDKAEIQDIGNIVFHLSADDTLRKSGKEKDSGAADKDDDSELHMPKQSCDIKDQDRGKYRQRHHNGKFPFKESAVTCCHCD